MSLLDPILNPFLQMNPLLATLLISFILSVIITIVYKLMTDQELMKTLKQDMKSLQKEMKELKNHPEKMMAKQKIVMDKNMKYMMHSMKPTLITILPIILIFGWLNANFAYEPILPGSEFDIDVVLGNNVYGNMDAKISAGMIGTVKLLEGSSKEIRSKTISYKFEALQEGEGDVTFIVNGEKQYTATVKIDPERYSKATWDKFEGKDIKKIKIGYQKKIVMDLFGWKIGWLGSYIIFSILFSLVLRKLLKLH